MFLDSQSSLVLELIHRMITPSISSAAEWVVLEQKWMVTWLGGRRDLSVHRIDCGGRRQLRKVECRRDGSQMELPRRNIGSVVWGQGSKYTRKGIVLKPEDVSETSIASWTGAAPGSKTTRKWWMWRRRVLRCVGWWRKDTISSVYSVEKMTITEKEKEQKTRLRWFGHVMRRDEEHVGNGCSGKQEGGGDRTRDGKIT